MYKILVIGEQCLDHYTYCITSRLSPEAPVPILNMLGSESFPGMASNVEQNLKSLGCEVDKITNKNVIVKQRFVDKKTNHQFFRVDDGDDKTNSLSLEELKSIPWKNYNAIVISDYNKGFLTEEVIQFISKNHPLTFLDTKKKLNYKFNDITWIKINEEEYETNYPLESSFYFKTIITKGEKGAILAGKEYPTQKVKIIDVTGAGDTFLAGLTVGYLNTCDIFKAIEFANLCASQVVQKRGTSIVNPKKL